MAQYSSETSDSIFETWLALRTYLRQLQLSMKNLEQIPDKKIEKPLKESKTQKPKTKKKPKKS